MPGRAGAEVALGPRAEMRPAALKKAGPMPNQFAIVSAWAGFVVVLLYANLFEYAFHRWLMHRLHRYISQPYETHVRLHHRIFGGDQRYHVLRAEHRSFILFECGGRR